MNTPDPITRLNAALEGRYRIERELGEGGMATVYLADDLKHERKVALKVLKPELAAVVGAERFLAEIKTTANLQHPHILALFDSGEADSLLFYVMPYVEGESLREKLDREHQLPVEEAVRITTNIAKALDYAHKQGVIHRDVKPSNILVARGEPLLADFGIAVRRHGEQGQRLTLTGPAPGTPAYMSPEQLDGEGLADERSDVYSLACVLFEMLCGTPPHASSGVWAMIARRLTGPVPSVRERFPLAPRQVEDALRAALERDLALRTSSAAAFAASLTMRKVTGDREPPQRESPRRADETQPPEHSVAVLPFANVGSGETDDFLSEGISEELRNALAGVRGLRVISRTSSVAFRDQGLSVTELATKLRVASVVEGSVRRIDDLVRVAVRLVDAGLDSNRWSETYEVRLNEVFGVQGEIAEQVARVLGARMRPVTHKSREPVPEAHALYLQARHIGDQITHDRLQRAIDLYKQALELDPEYAAAWDGLALRYTNLANISVSPDESWQLARAAAKKALSLDPDYALAHGHLGWVAMCYDGDLGQAAYHYQRALALDPHDSDIVGGAGMLARTLGHLDASNRLKQEVVSRDPVKPIGHSNLGIGCFYAGRWSDAERHLRMALTLSPAYVGAHFMLGLTYLRRGDLEKALGEVLAEEFEPFRLIGLALVHSALGAEAEAQSALTDLIQRHAGGWSYNIAYIHAFMGDPDAAFEWLERARELRDPGLTDILVQPFLENLHLDRRWPMFLESLGWSPRQLADIRFDPLGAIEAARGSTDASAHGVLTSSVAGG